MVATVFLIVDRYSEKKHLLHADYQELIDGNKQNVYRAEDVQANWHSNVEYMVTQADYLFKTKYNYLKLVELFDSMGAMFLCSEDAIGFWNEQSKALGVDIAVFNGSNSSFRTLKPEHFVRGLNILAGCVTKDLAIQLNGEYNADGMLFMGFDGFKHNYGTAMYGCSSGQDISEQMLKDYLKLSGGTHKLNFVNCLRVIQYHMTACKTCRACNYYSKEYLSQSTAEAVAKYREKGTLGKRMSYFRSGERSCRDIDCLPDIGYEQYFIHLYDEYLKANQEHERAKRSKGDSLKQLKAHVDQYIAAITESELDVGTNPVMTLEDAKKNLMENYKSVVDLTLSTEELEESVKHYLEYIMENEVSGDGQDFENEFEDF